MRARRVTRWVLLAALASGLGSAVGVASPARTSGTIRVDVSAVSGGEWVDVRVADSGCGMSPDLVARLGEPFTLNVGVVNPRQTGGAGLGLAICKGIVASHGGELTIESAVGVGTTVTARLRADLVEPVGARETTQVAA